MKMDTDVYTDKSVVQALAQFVPLKVQPNQAPELVKKFRILGTPMIYIVDADEKVWGHLNAPVEPFYFNRLVKEIAQLKKDYPKYLRMKEKEHTAESLSLLATTQAYQLNLEAASATLDKAITLNNRKLNDTLAHAAFIVAQGYLFATKIKQCEPIYKIAQEYVVDSVELSAIRSSLGAIYMITGKRMAAIRYFELVLRTPGATIIDRWCAEYQLGILKR